MYQKPLEMMSESELAIALAAAHDARQAAEYQDGLEAWHQAVAGAQMQLAAVRGEIDRRAASLKEKPHGAE